jgi:hypothetical protein
MSGNRRVAKMLGVVVIAAAVNAGAGPSIAPRVPALALAGLRSFHLFVLVLSGVAEALATRADIKCTLGHPVFHQCLFSALSRVNGFVCVGAGNEGSRVAHFSMRIHIHPTTHPTTLTVV